MFISIHVFLSLFGRKEEHPEDYTRLHWTSIIYFIETYNLSNTSKLFIQYHIFNPFVTRFSLCFNAPWCSATNSGQLREESQQSENLALIGFMEQRLQSKIEIHIKNHSFSTYGKFSLTLNMTTFT